METLIETLLKLATPPQKIAADFSEVDPNWLGYLPKLGVAMPPTAWGAAAGKRPPAPGDWDWLFGKTAQEREQLKPLWGRLEGMLGQQRERGGE